MEDLKEITGAALEFKKLSELRRKSLKAYTELVEATTPELAKDLKANSKKATESFLAKYTELHTMDWLTLSNRKKKYLKQLRYLIERDGLESALRQCKCIK